MNIQRIELGRSDNTITEYNLYFVNSIDNGVAHVVVYDEFYRENAIKKAESYILKNYGIDGWYLDRSR